MIFAWVIGWMFTVGLALGSSDDDTESRWIVLCVGFLGSVAWPYFLGFFIGAVLKDTYQHRKASVGVPRSEAQSESC